MKNRTKDMTAGTEWKLILRFAIPIMAGNLLQQFYNTADGIIVGNYMNANALAAVGNCATIAAFLVAIATGMGTGCGIIVSQFYGAGKEDELKSTVCTSMMLMVILALLSSAAGIAGNQWILGRLLKIESEEVLNYAEGYLAIYCMGLIFTYGYNLISYLLRAVGDSAVTLYFLIISTIINVVLDLLFVQYWGVSGTAAATVIAQAVSFFVSLIYMYRNYPIFRVRGRDFVLDKDKISLCLWTGIPTILQQCSVNLGQIVMQRLVNHFGEITMAAYTVGAKVERYITVPIQGIQTSLITFTGQNLGAKKPERARRGMWQMQAVGMVIAVCISIPVYLFAPQITRLFGLDGSALLQAVDYVHVCAPAVLIFCTYLILIGLLHGSGDVMYATFCSLSSLIARIVYSYVRVYVFHADCRILWRSLILAYGWSLIFAWSRYFRGKWQEKSKRIIKEENPIR